MRFVPAALAITLALGLPLPVQAVNTVELRGRLTDVVGTPLPGLHVVFRNPTTGVEFKARTDGDGCKSVRCRVDPRLCESRLGRAPRRSAA